MSIVTRLNVTDPDFDTAFARLLVSPAEADIGLPEKVSVSWQQSRKRAMPPCCVSPTSLTIDRWLTLQRCILIGRRWRRRRRSTRPSARRSRMQPTGFVTFTSVRLARVGNSRTLPARYWATHLPARPSRRLCSRGSGQLSLFGAHECDSREVAGVPEVVMVVPAPQDEISPAVMAAACLAAWIGS